MLFSRISNQSHSKYIISYLLSKILERTAYYSIFSVILLYADSLNFTRMEMLKYYDLFLYSMFITMFIGAVMGDLLIGNKKIMITGAILMSVAALLFSNPSKNYFFTGLIIFAIGNGLYAPNFLSGFAKLYHKNFYLYEAGYIILLFVINIAGLIGPLIIFSFVEKNDFSTGFIVAALLMFTSAITAFFTKQEYIQIEEKSKEEQKKSSRIVIFSVFSFGIFWYIFNGYFINYNKLFYQLGGAQKDFFFKSIDATNIYQFFSFIFMITTGVVFTIFYINRYAKILFGIILMIITFSILAILPLELVNNNPLYYLLITNIFVALAELLITPSMYALIARYANPKYYALLFALIYMPFNLLMYFTVIDRKIELNLYFYQLLLSLLYFGFLYLSKKSRERNI